MLSKRPVILLFLLVIAAAFSVAQTRATHSPLPDGSTVGNVIWQYDTKG
jgi:hypothetical protein